MHEVNALGDARYRDIPRFGEAVDQTLYRAAIDARS